MKNIHKAFHKKLCNIRCQNTFFAFTLRLIKFNLSMSGYDLENKKNMSVSKNVGLKIIGFTLLTASCLYCSCKLF